MPREPELDEIDCEVLEEFETDKSFCLRYGKEMSLFPKSEVTFKRRNVLTGKAVAEIPVWLLRDRNWLKPNKDSALDGFDDLTSL